MHPKRVTSILLESGCLSFVRMEEERLLSALKSAHLEAFALLSDGAKEALRETYRERLHELYLPSLMTEVREVGLQYDPLGMLLGQLKPNALEQAAADIYEKAAASEEGTQGWLHARYPLLAEYEAVLERNTMDAFGEFLDRLVACREDISERLLGGKAIHQVTMLSSGGADMHRHGRTVIGVTTDAGTFFYKPHDCRLDAFYEEVVGRWFSDCTTAPKVLVKDGYGFVSALAQGPVHSEDEVAAYFRHFGVLTALFHGLGSTDMHFENILACGQKPSAVDLETVVNTNSAQTLAVDVSVSVASKELRYSALRTGVLPMWLYGVGQASPLYCTKKGIDCLPEFDGQRVTVEGYEGVFAHGFTEGYERMLSHRGEIKEMLEKYRQATVRVLFRNTAFYGMVRQILYLPDHLKDEEGRQKAYRKLCSPYTTTGTPVETDLVDYEWSCLLQGDIPYYCTALDGYDLCGEEPWQVVKKGYVKLSAADSTRYLLDRLSRAEEHFEQDMIRAAFAHAALRVPSDEVDTPLAERPADREFVLESLKDVFSSLLEDVIHCTDGSIHFASTAEFMQGLMSCGRPAILGGVGACAAALARIVPELEDAESMAEECVATILGDLRELEGAKDVQAALPTGLYVGFASAIERCACMEVAGVKGAREAKELTIRLVLSKKLYEYQKDSVAEGAAGLLIALASESVAKTGELAACIRFLADRVRKALPGACADLPYGNAGYGAALAAAACVLQDASYAKEALRAFALVEEAYDEKLLGWPDSKAKAKALADRGPHAAGICLAAAYAKEQLADFEGDDVVGRVYALAKNSLLQEQAIYHKDCLDQGNALRVLALLKVGERDMAGRVLGAMIGRAKRQGNYSVTDSGISSFFDPSCIMGTTGISLAMARYLAQ